MAMDISTIISTISLSLAFITALIIVLYLFFHPQSMRVMNLVWPLTVLWSGLLGFAAFFSFGRNSMKMDDMDMPMNGMNHANDMNNMNNMNGMEKGMEMSMEMDGQKYWQKIALSTFHCGAGCTLADLIGESVGSPILTSFGLLGIGWNWTLDYLLALIIGAGFQYAAIRPMLQDSSRGKVFLKALRIDFLSLTSWQIGMYAFLSILFFIVLPEPLARDSYQFWFAMQLAMCAGFLFSFPMNWFLVKKGIKPSM